MSKFKSGDRVITTHQGGWYEPGETLTLTNPYPGWRGIAGWFVTKYPDNSRFVHESAIKLLEENMETNVKAMLKNGDRVGRVITIFAVWLCCMKLRTVLHYQCLLA